MSGRIPRLLVVGNFLSASTGVRGVCEELAERLRGRGWAVITTSRRRAPAARLLDMVATVIARRNAYDVAQVDIFSGRAFAWAAMTSAALRLVGRPYVATVHGGGLPELAARRSAAVRRVLGGAAAVTAPSAFLARALASLRDDIAIVPNAIDVAAYRFEERIAPRPRLVWLRAFHEVYDPELAVRVLERVASRFPGASLIMFGPDKGDGTLRGVVRLAEELGVSERITIAGAVAKRAVPERLHEGDVFLNTARVDNAPVTLLEPMACGLCVVSTDVGGVPDLVTDGVHGLLVPGGDAGAMAAAVERVLIEPGLCARLSAAARRHAETFDWGGVLPLWERVLSSAAQSPRSSGTVGGHGG